MGEWKEVAIAELAIGVYDGPHATPPPSDSGPVYLGIDNVTDEGRLDLSEPRRIADADFSAWTKRITPSADDIVFSYEATLHRYAVIPSGFHGCLGRRMALVRPDPSRVNPRWLYYAFLSPRWRSLMEANTLHGATVNRIPIAKFPTFKVWASDRRSQDRVAAVLTAYDELIENNTRRIGVLEEMTRVLYREWFVHMRPSDTSVGAGSSWGQSSLGECSTFLSGGTPSKSNPELWQGELPWVSSAELTAMRVHRTELTVSEHAVGAGTRAVPPETILCVVRGMSLAKEFRLGITARRVTFNQDVKAIVPHDGVDPIYLFHAIDDQRVSIRDQTGEAAHGTKKLDTAVLSKVPIRLPPRALQVRFREHVVPMHEHWDNLYQRNRALRAARDLLLPKLLSGELSVDRIPDPAEVAP